MDWKEKAKSYKFKENRSWTETSGLIQDEFFPTEDRQVVHERVRRYLRRQKEYTDPKDLYLEKKPPKQIKKDWQGNEVVSFGMLGDTHFGSKWVQITHLHDFYNQLKKEGITEVYHTGDITEGEDMRVGHRFETYSNGADDLTEHIAEVYPTGIDTYFLTGNHDHSIYKKIGHDIGNDINRMRTDMHYLGMDQAYIKLTPKCTLELRHPNGGSAYAISYKPQKMIDAMQGGQKPNILGIGHFHKSEQLLYRNIHTFQTGTFQAQTPFMRNNALAAQVGGWIIKVHVDKKGSVKRIDTSFIPYYEMISNDYKNWI